MPTTSTVRRRGTDSSGRGVYASDYLWDLWQRILADPAVKPFADKIVIVQGAWMSLAGGGAEDSAGYHDRGGCFDIRTRNLNSTELEAFIRTARRYGFAFWRRDSRHGMDPHAHGVCGSDHDLHPGARSQWNEYLNGDDGLSGSGADYEWRPSPLVTVPPEEDPMAEYADTLQEILATSKRAEAAAKATQASLAKLRTNSFERDKALKVLVKEALSIVSADAKTDKTVVARLRQIEQALDQALEDEA